MKNNIKISVVVPIYNVEEYLDECLLSLKRQTIKDIEVLMIDDGSLDHSADIAKRYEKENDNFHYFYKPNGGLGNARNYAISYVQGDYLIFLDSDDIVPEDAYEKMYNLAIKTNNDMIIGNVVRFNSKKVFDSPLHKKVFDDFYEHTHILENPNLVYDTTSWNKLFKTSFYKENNFQFPEKILYEDIPVTIPAHFKANSVGVITDICYLWRTRDGVSKSITQNRTELKNFTDRIKIMDMVNEFYSKNVVDERALLMKDYKWLDVDLKLYVNQFLDADDEYRNVALKEINRYLKTINLKSLQMLRAIDKIKYYYISQNKITELLKLLEYQKTTFKSLSIKKTKDHYIGNFPMNDIPKELKIMTDEIAYYPLTQSVERVNFKNHHLYIHCFFYVPFLKKQDEYNTRAYLYNRNNDKKIEVSIIRKDSHMLTSKFGYRFNRKPLKFVKYNYSHCAYNIDIDLKDKKILDVIEGNSFIIIEYQNNILKKEFILGKSNNSSLNLTQSYHLDNSIVQTHLINDGYLQIKYSEEIEFCDNTRIDDEKIYIDCLFPCFLDDGNHREYFTAENHEQSIAFSKIKDSSYYVFTTIDNHTVNLSLRGKSIVCRNDKNSIYVENDKVGHLKISSYVTDAVIDSFVYKNNKLEFVVAADSDCFDNAKLVLENKKFNYRILYEATLKEPGKRYNRFYFELNLENQDDIKNIAQGDYIFYIQNTPSHLQILYLPTDIFKKKVKLDERELVFDVNNNNLNMSVSHARKRYENSPRKRRLIRKYIYPLMRLLPLKKKCIVFEGWWGDKYHCNPKYFYEYIATHHSEYECVWLLNDNYIPVNLDAKRVRKKGLRYYYYLAVAKYFVNNVNFHDEYEKRAGQIEIQTMHGTPLKTLGLDVPGELDDPEKRKLFIKRCDRWDYLIVQSNKASEITSSCYAFSKEFLRTGYPRNDILFEKNNSKDISALKEKMGIPNGKKVIMYAPTWRKKNQFEMYLDLEDMEKKLGDEYILILRIHPFAYSGFDYQMLNDFVYNFSTYESVEELYLVSDIVITDYSSVMFDYTILNRPILFFTYDLVEYRDFLRGFNFNFEAEAPGPLIENYNDLCSSILNIKDISKEYDDALQKFRSKFNEYEVGTASKQVFDEVFKK